MLTLFDWCIFGIGFAILAVWLFLFVKGLQYSELFVNLDEKEYPFKEVYFVGYALIEMLHYSYKSKQDRKTRKELCILYGEKYAEYYLRVVYAQKITISLTLLAMAVPLYGLSGDILASLVVIGFAGVAYYYFGTLPAEKIKKRSEAMLHDFSNVVSKLALLTNAGMIMHEAWAEVAYTDSTELYKEMQITVDEMNNGMSEIDALYHFGSRCVVPEIKKFTSTIVQGLSKGNAELVSMLQEQSSEVWALKKQNVRRQGEKASSKLLIPMMVMFLGVLIMVVVPIFANLGA